MRRIKNHLYLFFTVKMNPCLLFTLTTAASLVAMSPATEMRDVREEDGRAGSALAEEHRGAINNSSEAYQQR